MHGVCAVLELAPGIASLTGLTALRLECPTAVPFAFICALSNAGGYLADLTMWATFLRAEDAEAFANVLPKMRGLTKLLLHVGVAGETAICAVARAAGRLSMLRDLCLDFPCDAPLSCIDGHGALRRAGLSVEGFVARNAATVVAVLPLLTAATTLEALGIFGFELSESQEAAAAVHMRAMPRLKHLDGIFQADGGPLDLIHLSVDTHFGPHASDLL
jgi:hypothetical protein